jgi:hypothetical protein
VRNGCNQAESSKEGCGFKRVVLLMMCSSGGGGGGGGGGRAVGI